MNKELKKCYRLMDLPYNATKEDIVLKKEIMIKMYNSKASIDNKDYTKKIKKVEDAENVLLKNIELNGIPNEKEPTFNSSWQSIFTLIVILCFVFAICFASFYVLT